ncbi:MAG: sigma-70 family RNA polymerase sigma factor [Ktedonobacterales bacterium]|nr:sigma-70 family RNA polymerase sigma factor [Ktedonobacterales bacterium]
MTTSTTTFDDLYADQFSLQVRHVQQRYNLSFDEAEDIVQVTFIQLWNSNPTLEGITSPRGFLHHRVGFMAHNYLRGRHRTLSFDAQPYPDSDVTLLDSRDWKPLSPSLEEQVLTRIELKQVAQRIAHWPLIEQVILGLNVQGFGHEQIYHHLVNEYNFTGDLVRVETALRRMRHELHREVRQKHRQQKSRRKVVQLLARGTWAVDYAACVQCGTTEQRHVSQGLCMSCYGKKRYQDIKLRLRTPIKQSIQQWSRKHVACISCGTTTVSHRALGYCNDCYRTHVRFSREGYGMTSPRKRQVVSLFR